MRKILKYELISSFKNSNVLLATLLFVIICCFIAYLALDHGVSARVWTSIYWIVSIFAALNISARELSSHASKHYLNVFQYLSPLQYLLSKSLYNGLLVVIINTLLFFVLLLLIPIQIEHTLILLLNLSIGSVGIALLFTFVSLIGSKVGNNFTINAVLSLPLVFPLLLIHVHATEAIVYDFQHFNEWLFIVQSCALNILILSLGLILFPYLWGE